MMLIWLLQGDLKMVSCFRKLLPCILSWNIHARILLSCISPLKDCWHNSFQSLWPCSVLPQIQKLRSPLLRTRSRQSFPLLCLEWVRIYSCACSSCCQESCFSNFSIASFSSITYSHIISGMCCKQRGRVILDKMNFLLPWYDFHSWLSVKCQVSTVESASETQHGSGLWSIMTASSKLCFKALWRVGDELQLAEKMLDGLLTEWMFLPMLELLSVVSQEKTGRFLLGPSCPINIPVGQGKVNSRVTSKYSSWEHQNCL